MHTVECGCGEVIKDVTTKEVLEFAVIECPRCGTDIEMDEGLYDEVISDEVAKASNYLYI